MVDCEKAVLLISIVKTPGHRNAKTGVSLAVSARGGTSVKANRDLGESLILVVVGRLKIVILGLRKILTLVGTQIVSMVLVTAIAWVFGRVIETGMLEIEESKNFLEGIRI